MCGCVSTCLCVCVWMMQAFSLPNSFESLINKKIACIDRLFCSQRKHSIEKAIFFLINDNVVMISF